MKIRWLIVGIPALLIALIVAAFINVSQLSTDKKNEMSIGTLGEPSTLNPIQGADAAASEVNSSIFNSLLKYSPDLEIIGDLAQSWTLDQTSTLLFKDATAAQAALVQVEGLKETWPAWKLTSARVEDRQLLLNFSLPGLITTEEIANHFGDALISLPSFRVELKKNSRAVLEEFSKTHSLLRQWVDTDSAFEITVDRDLASELKTFFDARPELEAKIQPLDTVRFLAEPQVVFTLRENVRWHDGAPFSSRDVVFTYRAIMDDATASPRKADFDLIHSVKAPDAHTVVVTYRKPYSPALNSWMIPIIPAHILEGKSQEWWVQNFNRAPIGTGPFKFSEWQTNQFIRVVRNPDFFEAPGPWLDAIVYRMFSDQLSLRLAFETRQVDFWGADPWAVGTFKNDPRFEMFSTPSSSYSYIGWNLRKPMFQDVNVRRALSHAVNVSAMVKYILYGNGLQSTGIFTPQMWFFNPHISPYAYDPEKAKRLLDEAGWKPGPDGIRVKNGERFSFTIITNNANEIRRDIAALAQDDLKKIGIEVKVETYEWAVLLKNYINKGSFDAMVLGWSLGFDYDQFQIWHSSQTNPEQLNVVGYQNEKVDRLLTDLRQEYDRDTIIRMAGEMQSQIYQDQPYLFLYVPMSNGVLWKDSYRIRRPDGKGGWVDTPVEMTNAGWRYWADWFYRPEYADQLPKETR